MKKKLLLKLLFFLITALLAPQSWSQEIFVNEIHYDNASSDTNEGIEVAGPAGLDLSGYSLVLYNGANSEEYRTVSLNGVIPELQGGFGVVFFDISGLQNGSPDGFALVDSADNVLQFLSYEGTITAIDGPAASLTSTDIVVEENSSTPVGYSLQLGGSGNVYSDFSWQTESESTYDAINNNQDFGGEVAPTTVMVNEVDADTEGTDVLEFVELFDGGIGNTDLSGKVLVFYNGSNNQSYATYDLNGYSTNAEGYFVLGNEDVANVNIVFGSNGLQNGADAVALYETSASDFPNGSSIGLDNLIDAFVYDTNDSDDAELLTLLNEGEQQINEDGADNKDFHSSQRFPNGSGDLRSTSTYVQALPTPGTSNTNITEEVNLIINEIDADTPGTDSEEFVELYDGGEGNSLLDGFVLVLYNGNNDSVYDIFDLSGYSTNEEGYFVIGNQAVSNVSLVVPGNTFQNGADAIALYKAPASNFSNGMSITTEDLVDAIVYGTNDAEDEGLLPLLNTGQSQVDEASNDNKDAHSLQRIPNGEGGLRNTAPYVATDPTPGTENGAEPEPTELISIAVARAVADGETVTITGVLTVSDQFAGSAYIQDGTGAIAVFDEEVHGDGNFAVGDSLTITGARSSYNDQLQISPVDIVEYNGVAENPITPISITLAELGEHPAELVSIENVNFEGAGDLIFGNSNYNITDASGSAELRVDADVDGLVGKEVPEYCETIVGVVGRYYEVMQLLPRSEADLPCAEDYGQDGGDLDISKELTLDMVTWNIEWFGDEGNSPAAGSSNSDEVQKEAVKAILLDLDADIVAVEEISDETLFDQMINEMEGYDYILSEATSYPDSPGGQKVGFVYKTATVEVLSSRPMFTSVHPYYNGGDTSLLTDYPEDADRFYASGRLPFLMTANVSIEGDTKEMNFIALHARANSGSGAQSRYDMRKYDVEVLKDSLDTYFADANVAILGDYNDDVDETVADVSTSVSTYEEYVNDAEDYTVLTAVLSEAGYRSYAFNNDVIDHVTVTNELTGNYIEGSARVHYEYYDSEYTTTASDHFPVSVRLQLEGLSVVSTSVENVTCSGTSTGTATVEVSGGISPYTYLWSDGQENATATNLSAKDYQVNIMDVLGNAVSAEVTIEEAEAIIVEMDNSVTFYKAYDDAVKLSPKTISGGDGEYAFSWNTGETTKEISVAPEETTEYELTVTDESGCSVSKIITVEVEDVSCGNGWGMEKVVVCYKGKSLCLPKKVASRLLERGATLGKCGSNDEIIIEKFIVYPNPTRGPVILDITSGQDANNALIEVYSLTGRLIITEPIKISSGKNKTQINLRRERTGIYLVKIVVDGEVKAVKKILKY